MMSTDDRVPTRLPGRAGAPNESPGEIPPAPDDLHSLISAVHPSLLAFARTMVADPHIADDLVQDTWIAVLRGHASFEGRSSFRTWVFGILRKRVLKSHAAEVRRREQLSLDVDEQRRLIDEQIHPEGHPAAGHWSMAPSDRFLPEDRIVSAEIRATVVEALDHLTPRQRQVVQLRDIEDLPVEDVCSILGIEPAPLNALLYRGRLRLRAILAERHAPDEPHHP